MTQIRIVLKTGEHFTAWCKNKEHTKRSILQGNSKSGASGFIWNEGDKLRFISREEIKSIE